MHASNLAKPEEPKKETSAVPPSAAKELVGTYKSSVELNEADARYKTPIEIKETDGKVFLVIPGQGTLELRQREKDVYSVIQLPDSNFIKVKRDATGKLESLIMARPQGGLQFKPVSKV